MKSLVLPAVALVALLAFLWFASRDEGTTPLAPDAAGAVDAPTSGDGLRMPVADPAPPDERRDAVDLDAPRTGGAGGAEDGDARTGTAALVVTVESRAGGLPLFHVPVFVDAGEPVAQALLVSGRRGSIGAGVASDGDGVARFDVPAGVRLRVFPRHVGYEPEGGATVDALGSNAFGVKPLAPGEERALRIHASAITGELHLAVVDASTRAAIAGAEVTLFGEPVAETDAGGRATYDLAREAYTALVVDAEGYGPAVVPLRGRVGTVPLRGREGTEPLRGDVGTEQEPLVVSLYRAATLRGTVMGLDEPAGTAVRVAASQHELVQPSDAGRWGFALSSQEFRAELDAAGSFVMEELPPNVALSARIARTDGTWRSLSNDELRLAPGEARNVRWDLSATARVVGYVVDEHGRALAGVRVAVEASDSVRWFGEGEHEVLAGAVTDDTGRFDIDGLLAGVRVVGVVSKLDDRDARLAAASTAERVTLEAGRTHEVELVVPSDTFLEARVSDVAGDAVEGTVVLVLADGADSPVIGRTDADGVARVGPLMPGQYRVRLMGNRLGNAAPPPPVDVVVPRAPLDLRLIAGAVASGRVEDAVTGRAVRADVARQSAFGDGRVLSTRNAGTAEFRYESLAPGTYEFVATEASGRVGVLRGVTLSEGETRDDLVISMRPASEVTVFYRGTRQGLHLRARDGSVVFHREELPRGAFAAIRAPVGPLVLEMVVADWTAPGSDHEVVVTRTIHVEADTPVEVTLE